MTRPVLHELVRALSFTNSSAFQRSLFSALFLVAFYGLFRIGELTAKSNRFASSVVQFGNLTFLSRNGRSHVAKITISGVCLMVVGRGSWVQVVGRGCG